MCGNMANDKTLYLECASGISGDMAVAALLDLGADEGKLRAALASLPLDGYRIEISRVKKSGLDACDFAVILDGEHENHDHDMEYLYGHLHGSACDGHHLHEDRDGHHDNHHGDGGHDNSRDCHAGTSHAHRGLPEIRRIIEAGSLSGGARALALRIFDILADAEAKAHGVPRDEVHFHEVGAVDSIVDIVAAAVCIDDLSPRRVAISPLAEGTGTVRCMHGILPVPVPAVTNIAAAFALPLERAGVQGELVTPTGAAIAAALSEAYGGGARTGAFALPGRYSIISTGIGAGKRDYDAAGILRAMWIRPYASGENGDTVMKLEANIDDSTGEQLAHCMSLLMEAGARDASFVPLYMKKNRPAYEIHVICAQEDVDRMERILFRETTTIGIRRVRMERTVMDRETRAVDCAYGAARVKVCRYGDIVKAYPEYESAAELSRSSGRDLASVCRAILEAYYSQPSA